MNPYEPPKSPIELPNTEPKFYSVGQITTAALIGAPIAPCILIAQNYRQVDRRQLGRKWIIWGSIGTVILVTIGFFVPHNFPSKIITLGYVIAFYRTAKRLRMTDWVASNQIESRKGSWWAVLGVSLFSFLVLLVVVVIVVFAISLSTGESIDDLLP